MVESCALISAALAGPPVEVYLRGVADEPEAPETWVAWRRDVADLVRAGPEVALSFVRLRSEELVRVPAAVAKQIVHEASRREKGRGLPLIVFRGDGELHAAWVHDPAELPCLAYATVVLAPCPGGLAESGLPDATASAAVADVGDTPDQVRYLASGCGDEASDGVELPAWAEDAIELRVPIPDDGDGTKARAGCMRVGVPVRIPRLGRGRGDLARGVDTDPR